MVDGKAYHLAGSKEKSLGSGTSVRVQQLHEDKGKFEWFYKGQLKRSLWQIQRLIQKINSKSLNYHIAFANCIDVAQAFIGFARGFWNYEQVEIMILPNSPNWAFLKGTGVLRGVQLFQEGANLMVP